MPTNTQGTLIETVKSTSTKGTTYQIRRGADSKVYCTCKGWKFYGRCKHLEAFKTRQEELTEIYS